MSHKSSHAFIFILNLVWNIFLCAMPHLMSLRETCLMALIPYFAISSIHGSSHFMLVLFFFFPLFFSLFLSYVSILDTEVPSYSKWCLWILEVYWEVHTTELEWMNDTTHIWISKTILCDSQLFICFLPPRIFQ